MKRSDIYKLISDERNRQEVKFGSQSIAGPDHSLDTRLRILVEEVGEVAEAIDRVMRSKNGKAMQDLKAELVQVCAVGVGWLEVLP